ncbi:MAG: hydrogenase maturation protease [Candidatus Lokiarchaeota archaeon]|nr:hydrogenase maturation protease [Candidatus Lokiarchaeota archaeon]
MNELYKKLFERLKDAKRIVFLGIGETKMTDDAVGPYIITELLNKNDENFLFINAKIDPLARMSEIVEFRPSHMVILDTCTLQKEPGTVAIIERENMHDLVPISSHTMPIHIVIDYLLEQIPDLKDVFMIGFVPKSLEGFIELTQYKEGELSIEEINENEDLPFFDFQLTEEIKNAADQIIAIIKKLIKEL